MPGGTDDVQRLVVMDAGPPGTPRSRSTRRLVRAWVGDVAVALALGSTVYGFIGVSAWLTGCPGELVLVFASSGAVGTALLSLVVQTSGRYRQREIVFEDWVQQALEASRDDVR